MEKLWKGIAIAGIWIAVAMMATKIGLAIIMLGFFAVIATGFLAMAN